MEIPSRAPALHSGFHYGHTATTTAPPQSKIGGGADDSMEEFEDDMLFHNGDSATASPQHRSPKGNAFSPTRVPQGGGTEQVRIKS